MTTLLELKEKLTRFYGKYDILNLIDIKGGSAYEISLCNRKERQRR